MRRLVMAASLLWSFGAHADIIDRIASLSNQIGNRPAPGLRIERADLIRQAGYPAAALFELSRPAAPYPGPYEQKRRLLEARCLLELGKNRALLDLAGDSLSPGIAGLACRAALIRGDVDEARRQADVAHDPDIDLLVEAALALNPPHDGIRLHAAPAHRHFSLDGLAPVPAEAAQVAAARRAAELTPAADPFTAIEQDTDWPWREAEPRIVPIAPGRTVYGQRIILEALDVPSMGAKGVKLLPGTDPAALVGSRQPSQRTDITENRDKREVPTYLVTRSAPMAFTVQGPTILRLRLRRLHGDTADTRAATVTVQDGANPPLVYRIPPDRPASSRKTVSHLGFTPGSGRRVTIPIPTGLHSLRISSDIEMLLTGNWIAPRATTRLAAGHESLQALSALAAEGDERARHLFENPPPAGLPTSFPAASRMWRLAEILAPDKRTQTDAVALAVSELKKDPDDPWLNEALRDALRAMTWRRVTTFQGDISYEKIRESPAHRSISARMRAALAGADIANSHTIEVRQDPVEQTFFGQGRIVVEAFLVSLGSQPSGTIRFALDGAPWQSRAISRERLERFDVGTVSAGRHRIALALDGTPGAAFVSLSREGRRLRFPEPASIVEYVRLDPGTAMRFSVPGHQMIRIVARRVFAGSGTPTLQIFAAERRIATIGVTGTGKRTAIEERVGAVAGPRERFEILVPGGGNQALRLTEQKGDPLLIRIYRLAPRQETEQSSAGMTPTVTPATALPLPAPVRLPSAEPEPMPEEWSVGSFETSLRYGRNVDPNEEPDLENSRFGADYLDTALAFRRRFRQLPVYLRLRVTERDLLPSGALITLLQTRLGYRRGIVQGALVAETHSQRLDHQIETAFHALGSLRINFRPTRTISIRPGIRYDVRSQPLDSLESFRRDQVDLHIFFPYWKDHPRIPSAEVRLLYMPYQDLGFYLRPALQGNKDASLDRSVVDGGVVGYYKGFAFRAEVERIDRRKDENRRHANNEMRYTAGLRYSFFDRRGIRYSVDAKARRLADQHQTDFFAGFSLKFDHHRSGRDQDPAERWWILQEEASAPY